MSDDTAREIANIRVEIGRQGEQIKTLYKRVDRQDELIGTVNRLALSVEKLAAGQEDIKSDIKDMRVDVDDFKRRPAKRWEAVIAAAISAIVAYIIGRITKGV
jgi:hypothetical protein